jgi:sigma-B regulation protein RsbU (phosphoserine phosphatase)
MISRLSLVKSGAAREHPNDRRTGQNSAALNDDLDLARTVQRSLLPKRSLLHSGLTCAAFYQASQSVGGDYYDFVPLNGDRLGIAIGDVSGKGIAAALIMANLQASLRGRLSYPCMDPLTLVRSLNRSIYESSPLQFYVSLFYGEYDPSVSLLRYVNAGHHPPWIVRVEDAVPRVSHLPGQSMLIGAFAEALYEEQSIQLHPGDLLVAYTDGLTDSQNIHGEDWGQQRLQKTLFRCAGRNPAWVVHTVMEDLERFTDNAHGQDDLTLVVARVENSDRCPIV